MEILRFFKIKYSFRPPNQAEVLIFDNVTNLSGYSSLLFNKKNTETLFMRMQKVNLFILSKSIFLYGFRNLKLNYLKTFLEFVKPKIVYTAIDNSPVFFDLKTLYPKATYIADQNGHRQMDFYNTLKQRKLSGKLNNCDYYFIMGTNTYEQLKDLITGKLIVLGNTLNNHYFFQKKLKKKRIITYISSKLHRRENLEKKIFKILLYFSKKHNYKLFYLDRPGKNNKYYINNKLRLDKIFNDNSWHYFANRSSTSKFKLLASSDIIAFAMSTLGYECLSRGYRCISFNHTFYNLDIKKKYNSSGPFWTKPNNYRGSEKLMFKILNTKKKNWKKIYKKYSHQILWMDRNNVIKKRIINKLLNK